MVGITVYMGHVNLLSPNHQFPWLYTLTSKPSVLPVVVGAIVVGCLSTPAMCAKKCFYDFEVVCWWNLESSGKSCCRSTPRLNCCCLMRLLHVDM